MGGCAWALGARDPVLRGPGHWSAGLLTDARCLLSLCLSLTSSSLLSLCRELYPPRKALLFLGPAACGLSSSAPRPSCLALASFSGAPRFPPVLLLPVLSFCRLRLLVYLWGLVLSPVSVETAVAPRKPEQL